MKSSGCSTAHLRLGMGCWAPEMNCNAIVLCEDSDHQTQFMTALTEKAAERLASGQSRVFGNPFLRAKLTHNKEEQEEKNQEETNNGNESKDDKKSGKKDDKKVEEK